MKCFDINLALDYDKYELGGGHRATMTCYLPSNFEEFSADRKRPAMIVCPGGGYKMRSAREAEPIALQYVAADMAAFVVHYSVDEDAAFPRCVLEALTAIKTVRENAAAWDIDPDKIAISGFSAGGHLAASAGAFWNADFAKEVFGNCELCKPNAAVLCYPVITSGIWAHRGSFNKLVGEDATQEQLDLVSIEKQVTESYPPSFIWHTGTDGAVPVNNSLFLAQALAEKKVLFELHVYPTGVHGLSLSDERTSRFKDGKYVETMMEKRPRQWVSDSILFLKESVFNQEK
ncbi:MAG: alpha/beta hydrolase [Clostridia bacterium]|nr:alpha/beta hydrolase [Clostridia bacterium]